MMKKFCLLSAGLLMAAAMTLTSCQKADDPVAPREQDALAQGDLPVAILSFSDQCYANGPAQGSGKWSTDVRVYSQSNQGLTPTQYKRHKITLKCAETNYIGSFSVRMYVEEEELTEHRPGDPEHPMLLLYPLGSGRPPYTVYTGQPLEWEFTMVHNWNAPAVVDHTYKIVFEVTDTYGDKTTLTVNMTGRV